MPEENSNHSGIQQSKKETKGYYLIQNCFESYMTFCLVYEEVQTSLIDKNEVDAVENQILWNAECSRPCSSSVY